MAHPVSPMERVNAILRGLVCVLDHHGVPQTVIDSFRTQVTSYLAVPDEKLFFKRAKYLTVAPMAQYLRCEAPKAPDQPLVWTGQWKAWSHARLRVVSRRNTHLWYSFLQAKRAALPLSDELVLTTYQEHRAAMEVDDPIDDETCQSVMKELKPVLRKLKRGLAHALRVARDDGGHLEMEAEHVASTRACFEASRTKGGQIGRLTELCPAISTCNPLNPVERRTLPDLVSMRFFPRVLVNGVVRLNYVMEIYEYTDGMAAWKRELLGRVGDYAPRMYTRELWHDGDRYTIFTEKPVRLKCTIQAVLEPLKVRVISKGEAVPYYLAKPLQKAFHGLMRDMDCFRLIGRPLCPTDLIDLKEHRVEGGEGRYEWFSIDYSAATDRLSAKLSKSILGYLVEGQDRSMVSLWKAVLAPHRCQYPFPYNAEVEPVVQKNGQLMGSILSFPILCLANLGLYLAAISDDQRPLREKLAGVLVNGDDMLYVARRSRWETHVALGARVGLSMSPGKAYHHPVYANANSACFHFDLESARSTPWSIPFLNTGLYFGQSKVMGGDDVDMDQSLTSTIPKLLQGALPGRQCDLLKQFLSRHSKEIAAECRGRNLFISKTLGGMGVPLVPGWKTDFTLEQRLVATERWNNNPYLHWGNGPAISVGVEEAPQPLSAPWLAVLHFDVDEDGETVAVTKEKVEQRLDVPVGLLRSLKRSNFEGYRWIPKSKLFLDVHLCAHRRERCGEVRIPRRPCGNPFVRRMQQDWLLAAVTQVTCGVEFATPCC